MKKLILFFVLLFPVLGLSADEPDVSDPRFSEPYMLHFTIVDIQNLLNLKLPESSEPLVGIGCLYEYINSEEQGVMVVIYGHENTKGETVFEGLLTVRTLIKRKGLAKYENGRMLGPIMNHPFRFGDETDLYFYDIRSILGIDAYYRSFSSWYIKGEESQREQAKKDIEEFFWHIDRSSLAITMNQATPNSKGVITGSRDETIIWDNNCKIFDAKNLYNQMMDFHSSSEAAEKEKEKQRKKTRKF
jgi:hypothetical protein